MSGPGRTGMSAERDEVMGKDARVIALIQARLGSTRLPGKMLRPLRGLPLIDWVLRRAGKSEFLTGMMLATTTEPRDDALARHVEAEGIPVFRGPEDDVLERFRLAGLRARATHVVRVCADNPLLWGGEIDALIRRYFSLAESGAGETGPKGEAEGHWKTCGRDTLRDNLYVYNHIPRNNLYPDGLGAEMISYNLLEDLAGRAVLPAHREHCFSFIWDNPDLFSIHTFDPSDPRLHRPDIKLDIDTAEDYEKLSRLDVTPDSPPLDVVRAYDAL